MPCASSLTPESRFSALFVGPKHSGKTVAACSWISPLGIQNKKRIKVLDGDGGIRGILGAPWIHKDLIDYDYYPPRTVKDPKTKLSTPFFERVNNDLDVFITDMFQGRNPYETYICDSATAFTRNLMFDALPLTHADNGGRYIGDMLMAGLNDYNYESTGFDAYLSALRSLPMNLIMTAHVIDKYDKPLDKNGNKDPYGESIKVGERLVLRDKIAAATQIFFDHIFRFHRVIEQGKQKFYVEYISDIACTRFPGLPIGKIDITGQNFYEFTMKLVKERASVETTAVPST